MVNTYNIFCLLIFCIGACFQAAFMLLIKHKGYNILTIVLKICATLVCFTFGFCNLLLIDANSKDVFYYGIWVILGLLFSCIADGLIGSRHCYKKNSKIFTLLFYFGIIGFLLTQICYFVATSLFNEYWYLSLLFGVLSSSIIVLILGTKNNISKTYKFFGIIYIGSIFAFVINTSVILFVNSIWPQKSFDFAGAMPLFVGSILFLLSDSAVIYNAFFPKLPKQTLVGAIGLCFYFLAQMIIASSIYFYN